MSNKRVLICLAAALFFSLLSIPTIAEPIPIWSNTLESDATSTVDGGAIVNGPATYVSGAVGNAFAGNGSVYAQWDNATLATLFDSVWNNAAGSTVDLFFSGDHWDTHSGDSGFWSVTDRYDGPDGYIMLTVRDGKLRFPYKDSYSSTDATQYLTGIALENNVIYRLTVRQKDTGFEVYLDGGVYSNTAPIYTAVTTQTISFPAYNNYGGNRYMCVGNRAVFGGILQAGEWVDNIRVYNGYYTPAEIGTPIEPPNDGDINDDSSVDSKDLTIITDNWLQLNRGPEEGNLNEIGPVDFADFTILAGDWLIGAAISITSQPVSRVVAEGQTTAFTIQAHGSTPITYQWQKNEENLSDSGNISGATTEQLQITNAQVADEGTYRCIVGNEYSSVISDGAALTVNTGTPSGISVSSSGHYVTYNGQTLMLVGDSGTQCAAQNSNLNHRQWIDDCYSRGIRAIHVWSFVPARQKQDGTQIEPRWGYVYPDVMPWARKTSGPLALDQKFQWNLQTFDEGADGDYTHYWPRMRDMAAYAKSKNMLLGITMFTGWTKHDYAWIFHPLNVNNGGHLTLNTDAVILAAPGTEVWQEPYDGGWTNAKKTQWVWEQLSIKFINDLGSMGNVFFVFFDEHSYSDGNMEEHFADFFRSRGQVWMDQNSMRSTVDWVMSGTFSGSDKNSNAVSGFIGTPARPYFNLEGSPYMGDGVREAIWTFSVGGGNYVFHADEDQETVTTGIMGYDPYVPGGDKGMYKRDWLGHASRFFNQYVTDLDSMVPTNGLTSSGAYCLADNGGEYVIYSKTGYSSVTVNLSAAAGKTLNCRFYNPVNGTFNSTFQCSGGSSAEVFTKPDSNDWILHIVDPLAG